MRTRDPYVVELAQTVNSIFAQGKTDPSAEEIAATHFPGRALGGEIIDGIRKRLRRVRYILETDYDQPVYLLSSTYYTRYRDNKPQTEDQARKCIPGGYGVTSAGIALNVNGDADLIYQATLTQNFSSGAGKYKKSADRTLGAVEEGRMTGPVAAPILQRAANQAQPSNPALASRVMQGLPPAGKRTRNLHRR